MVKCTNVESVQSYLERVTNKCFCVQDANDCKSISQILKQEHIRPMKKFAFKNLQAVIESNLDVVLVECWGVNKYGQLQSTLWWYEIPSKS